MKISAGWGKENQRVCYEKICRLGKGKSRVCYENICRLGKENHVYAMETSAE